MNTDSYCMSPEDRRLVDIFMKAQAEPVGRMFSENVLRGLKAVLAERDSEAAKAIEEHNAECERLCDNRKRCGYEGYRSYMSCPNCPKDWKIELSCSATGSGS